MNNQLKAIRTAIGSLFLNLFMAILKGIVGYFGNSFALIADAIESIGDVFSSFLVVGGLKYASKPPDKNHPYGHGKAEPLITFVVVGFLCASATLIIVESIHYIQTPHLAPKSYTLYFLGVIILVKELFYRIVVKRGKETGSSSLVADAWHHRSDAITSLFAFSGILIAVIFGNEYAAADDWAALIASGIIFYNAYKIFRPALSEIMDEHVHDEIIATIRSLSMEVAGIEDTEKCFVRKSGMRYWVDIHIHVNGQLTVDEGHTISHDLKTHLLQQIPQIEDVLVHVEPV